MIVFSFIYIKYLRQGEIISGGDQGKDDMKKASGNKAEGIVTGIEGGTNAGGQIRSGEN